MNTTTHQLFTVIDLLDVAIMRAERPLIDVLECAIAYGAGSNAKTELKLAELLSHPWANPQAVNAAARLGWVR